MDIIAYDIFNVIHGWVGWWSVLFSINFTLFQILMLKILINKLFRSKS
jgi:hypothetical protein